MDNQETASIIREAAIAMERAYNEIQHLRKRVEMLTADLQAKDQELQISNRRLSMARNQIRRLVEGEL